MQLNRQNKNGFAMVFAALAILILSLLGSSFLETVQRHVHQRGLSTAADFSQIILRAQVEAASVNFARDIEPRLLKASDANVDNAIQFATWISSKNGQVIERPNGAEIKLENLACLFEEETVSSGTQLRDCTFSRARMPKTFLLTLSYYDPKDKIFLKVKRQFQIRPKSANQYSMVVLNHIGDASLGKTIFSGSIGMFFSDPQSSTLNLKGARINGNVATNLPETRVVMSPDNTFKGRYFSTSPSTFINSFARRSAPRLILHHG